MAFNIGANCIFFPGLLAITILTLPLISTENIDCKGKSFHCVNSTHFKICVDLGGGVTRTVDEFLIPCPRSTVCNDINKFECEYQVTTTLSPIQQSDEANVLAELSTTSATDVTTSAPENDTNNSGGTTIDISYEFINNDTSYFIPSTTLDDSINQVNSSSANNFKFDKISDLRDEYQLTTTLPPTKQTDVATLAVKNDTSNSSVTTFEKSFEFTNNNTSNFINSTTSDDTLNQVYSSSANNFKHNKTSDLLDEYQVTTVIPSIQQSDVVNELSDLDTTLVWDNVNVTTFAPENDTYSLSATTIGTSYEFINNDTSNFISTTTSDGILNPVNSSSANNFKHNKTSDLLDEYQVTTVLPSIQQSDVVNELSDLDTTLVWDNVDVTTFAPENDTYSLSATMIGTSYEFINNDTSNFISTTTSDGILNQVYSSSANNFKHNKSSDLLDEYQVTTSLPSTQQNDVINELSELDTTSAWDNFVVTTFAPENDTYNSSATTISTNKEFIENDTSNLIANSLKYNETSDLRDQYQIPSTHPSTQLSDVTNESPKMGTPSAWGKYDVTSFAPENDIYNSSATTITTSYEFINNDNSNFIASTTSDETLNQVYFKSASYEYQVTTTLPSTLQRDVNNELSELDTTLTWDNADVTTFALENYTYNLSATTIATSNQLINNVTFNFIPSTSSNDKLNQVNSSSANNINYNKISDVSDSATVTNTNDDSTVNAKITLNDTILNATLNKSITLISDELSLSKTIQGTTELNIDALVLNNSSLYGNNNEHVYTNKERRLSFSSSEIVRNPISYSSETTSFLSHSNTSTTPMTVSSNLNIPNYVSISLPNSLKPTITANLHTLDPINGWIKDGDILTTSTTTVGSDPTTNLVLNVTETVSSSDDIKSDITIPVIRQIYSDTENNLRKVSTDNVFNGRNGFTINVDEQNKTETLFTLVSSYSGSPSTKSVESSTVPNKFVDLTSLTRNNNDWQNSENIVTSSIYATDSVSQFPNQIPDDQLIEMENKYDVINPLVTPHDDILSEILDTEVIASNESLTKDMMKSNTTSEIEILSLTEADLKASNLKVLNNDSIFSTLNYISLMGNLKDISFTNLPESNVTNDTMYKETIVDLTTISNDKLPANYKNTNAENISSVGFNNNNTTLVFKDTTADTTLKADLYNTNLTVSDTAFTFATNPPLINTTPLNINFNSTPTINTQYTPTPKYFQPTIGANPKIHIKNITTIEIPSSSDFNLDMSNRIFTNYPNTSARIETFDKDNRDSISSNLTVLSTNENRTVLLIDTTTIDPNKKIEMYEKEKLNDFYSNRNNISENIANGEKTGVFINSPNITYGQLNIHSPALSISTDTILNNSSDSYVNENEVVVEDLINNNDIFNNNDLVKSSVNQNIVEKKLNTTQKKEMNKIFNLPLRDVNITVNNEMINGEDVIGANLPIQTHKLITLKTYENKSVDVNTETSELISTTETVMIPVSSNLSLTKYKEPTKTYDSVISYTVGTTNPYIYQEHLTIAEPNDQQNATNSKLFVDIEYVDSGLLSTPHNASENNIQDLKLSKNETEFISDAIIQSSPFLTKTSSTAFENSLNVDTTVNLAPNLKNIAQAISSVEILNKNDNNSSSTISNINKHHKNVTMTTNNIEVINNEANIIGMLNNVTLTQNIDKIKSESGANALSNTKTLPTLENKPAFNFELTQNLKQLNNESKLKHNENENNDNIVALLDKTNNSTSPFTENGMNINKTLKLLQADLNLNLSSRDNVQLSNIVKTTPIPTSTVKSLIHSGNRATPLLEQFTCEGRHRGKYSDKSNCNKFYICIGKLQPIIGMCPEDTVFSEIRKQCTNNLSHCIRNNQFKCISSGRFVDVLSENFYYICVKKLDGYVRFKLQCQKGYHLNKDNIQCSVDTSSIENSSNTTSDKSTKEIKSDDNSYSENYEIRFECEKEGKFEYPDDCRKYFLCRKSSKSKFRRKIKKCSSDEVFNKEKRKCVDADSYEC
ncbi:protein PF3D7_1417600-like [Vanessa atalanta]|uniref:protein PF3D7_1417600-like n=1 Tax=Vanessa atalanta TaxID=42275 RepID=UPI001FCD8239|nr:protein PF3D7_1417600-like [Vanessa atalanta]